VEEFSESRQVQSVPDEHVVVKEKQTQALHRRIRQNEPFETPHSHWVTRKFPVEVENVLDLHLPRFHRSEFSTATPLLIL